MSHAPLRIGNASGFYGDRFSGVQEMLEGGALDVLTGDYLAELTMLILGRSQLKDPKGGYASTFLRQMEGCLGLALDKGVKVVVNAGGLNPRGLAGALNELSTKLGLSAKIAHVEGDDLRARAGELGFGSPLTANAYLGAWGIVACLDAGADVVVTGRVTDASLVVGPAAAHFGWARDNWDALAGATAAGHVLECGAQATGGNYAFFDRHSRFLKPGFPLAEIHADGSSVITKHAGTEGVVEVGTVTAQLVYEIDSPRYAGPDVTTRFDSLRLRQEGPDRVRIEGAKGEPPPPTLKVCLNRLAGFRNETTFVLTGLDIDKKAELVRAQLEASLASHRPAELIWSLYRTERDDADTEAEASALLRCLVKDPNPAVAGKAFSAAAIELALSSYPGFHVTAPPSAGSPIGVYSPAYVPATEVPHVAILPDGSVVAIAPTESTLALAPVPEPVLPAPLSKGPTQRVHLGLIAGARSGDKGGNANVGVWTESIEAYSFLVHELTVQRLRELLPETAALPVKRHLLPELFAMNFVVEGILGEGVASATRFDPQAKALGEWLRSRKLEVPVSVVAQAQR